MAFLEESVAQLSDEFYSQQRELDALKKQYANLIDKLNSPHSGEVEHNIILNEKPPALLAMRYFFHKRLIFIDKKINSTTG